LILEIGTGPVSYLYMKETRAVVLRSVGDEGTDYGKRADWVKGDHEVTLVTSSSFPSGLVRHRPIQCIVCLAWPDC
jgi:hypothetical protein